MQESRDLGRVGDLQGGSQGVREDFGLGEDLQQESKDLGDFRIGGDLQGESK